MIALAKRSRGEVVVSLALRLSSGRRNRFDIVTAGSLSIALRQAVSIGIGGAAEPDPSLKP